MQKITKRFIIWTIIVVLIILIPLAMQSTAEVQWNEATAYIVILLALGGFYELWHWLKTCQIMYRFAFVVGLLGAFFVGWVNGAVGIIGSEDNPANLLYVAVFVVGFIGSIVSGFRPYGMARTLFLTAVVQLLIPIFALFIWPAKVSWGGAGVIGVLVFNSIFALIFVVSALLFQQANKIETRSIK